jgi:hypothetical protein
MSCRYLAAAGCVAVILAAVSVSVAGQGQATAQGQAAGQAQTPKPPAQRAPAAIALDKAKASLGEPFNQPKTTWGDPDLQGVWSYATTTPLSRPDASTKDIVSDEEAAADEEQASIRQDAPPRPGDTGTYNDFWWDRGKKIDRPSLIIDPPDGKLPLKPEAAKARSDRAAYLRTHPADSYLDRSPTDRCIIYHGVPPVPSGYSNTYQIVQVPGMVAILDEEIHHVRLVPLDGRPHLTDRVRHWNGDSRGHWEGNTLVVETTNFNDKTALRYQGSDHTVAVERFKRVSADMIDYQYTITDPTVFTQPFTVAIPMPRRDDKIFEYACHEGNHSIVGILGGTRAEEKAAEAAAKSGSR